MHAAAIPTTLAVLLAATVAGCGGSAHAGHTSAKVGCPITNPSGAPPPPSVLQNLGMPIGKASSSGWYGNGVLWTQLPWTSQSVRTPSGLLSMKVPWFRARDGTVTIDARPLHGPKARFAANVGSPASYGPTGFAPSIIAFGRTGCWRLDAHLAGTTLEVVLRVYRAAT